MTKWIIKKIAMSPDNLEIPELEDGYEPLAITEIPEEIYRHYVTLWLRKKVENK